MVLWGYTSVVAKGKRTQKASAGIAAQGDTRERLAEAALREFNEHGYFGTDTNKIARRAGFAPQTFYRWFRDKAEGFIAAYRLWEDEERVMLWNLLERRAATRALVDAIVSHHRSYLGFRRSLRQLAVEDDAVRLARAESRKRQIAATRDWLARPAKDDGDIAAAYLQMERLADALAEGELEDLGLPAASAERALAALIESLRYHKAVKTQENLTGLRD